MPVASAPRALDRRPAPGRRAADAAPPALAAIPARPGSAPPGGRGAGGDGQGGEGGRGGRGGDGGEERAPGLPAVFWLLAAAVTLALPAGFLVAAAVHRAG